MRYFVTGATGFIGRHLVERAAEARGHDLRARARGLARAARGAAVVVGRRRGAASCPVIGDLTAPGLGVSDADREQLEGVDHFFHLAAIYDMSADEESNRRANVDGTRHAVELANDARRGHLPPHQLDRRVRAATAASSARTCSTRARSSPTPTRAPSSSPRSSSATRRRCRGACTGPRSSSVTPQTGEMDKIDGPYYFFKVIQKLRDAGAAVDAGRGPRGRQDQRRAGRLRRERDGPHRAPAGPRRTGVPPDRPEPEVGRPARQHVRARRARARGDACASTAR